VSGASTTPLKREEIKLVSASTRRDAMVGMPGGR